LGNWEIGKLGNGNGGWQTVTRLAKEVAEIRENMVTKAEVASHVQRLEERMATWEVVRRMEEQMTTQDYMEMRFEEMGQRLTVFQWEITFVYLLLLTILGLVVKLLLE